MVHHSKAPRPSSAGSPADAPGPRRSAYAEDRLRRHLRTRLQIGPLASCDHLQDNPDQMAAWAAAFADRWVCAGCLGSLDAFVHRLQLAGHLVLACAICDGPPEHLVTTQNATHLLLGFFCGGCLQAGEAAS